MDSEKGKQKKKKKVIVAMTVKQVKKPDVQGEQQEGKTESKLGYDERQMILTITGPQPELPYPKHVLQMSDGTFTQEYDIPEELREAVFQELYLFDKIPSMDTIMLDIHEDKTFKVSEFRVIREGEGNFIVSPYYPISGGTLLDWIPAARLAENSEGIVVEAKAVNCKSDTDY